MKKGSAVVVGPKDEDDNFAIQKSLGKRSKHKMRYKKFKYYQNRAK